MLHDQRRIFFSYLPATLILIMVLIGMLRSYIPFMPVLGAFVFIAPFYYFSLYPPSSYSYGFVFVLGIFVDAIQGSMLGISALLLLLMYRLIATQRKLLNKEPFWVVWAVFAFLLGGFMASYWSIFSLFEGQQYALSAIVMQWVITSLLYPLVHAVCGWIQQWMMRCVAKI